VQVLGESRPLGEFNRVTYFRDQRENLAGTLLAHDHVDRGGDAVGVFALEFWPTDPVPARLVAVAFKAVAAAIVFAPERVAYHPAGETQAATYERDKAELAELGVRSITTEELFGGVAYSPLNLGEGFGRLRVIDPARPSPQPPTARDVIVFESLPNDLAHVAGVMSATPQTPLSHVNLKARQNGTPNAYVRDAAGHPQVKPSLGKLVRYEVAPDGFSIAEATQAEVDEHLEKLRPPQGQRPAQDLSVTAIAPLDELTNADSAAFGAKAANVGELRRLLPAQQVPNGFAIPFSFYARFVEANDLPAAAAKMLASRRFQTDPEAREEALEEFRHRVKDAKVPKDLAGQMAERHHTFPASQPLRCRSSTNNEDLQGFNGAGLYDSFTHRPDEGQLTKTVKQVWASLWNYRAFEERDFYRIDHQAVAMGVLVHPNYDDERANGVAVTKNIYDPNWTGFYVNVQVGENLVTNPDAASVPDEFLISAIGEHEEYETQYIRRSNQSQGRDVLTREQIGELVVAMAAIQAHFATVYGREGDREFAMDIEFKVTAEGSLLVKQARPWVG
jgi:hypothetical protein